MLLAHMWNSMWKTRYNHRPPSPYSILGVDTIGKNSNRDLSSTLTVINHSCMGKTSSWRAFAISW